MSEEFEGVTALARSQFMPAMSIESAVERYNAVTEFVSRVLRRDVDYGRIPGTDKLTLLKPGAEKLTTFFGLSTRFQLVERIEDWTGADHDGEPFFYYLYRCQLHRGDLLVAEADGSCNSRETKYRYRNAERRCPECDQPTVIKGKEEYGGGYICFRKKGGCGAKFRDGDPSIESQTVGRVLNPDIADTVNTIQKMGQKRSLIASVLIAVNASEFFTQDVEDFRGAEASAPAADATPPGAPVRDEDLDGRIREACRALGRTEGQLSEWLRKKYGVGALESLTAPDRRDVLALLGGMAARRTAA